MTKPRLFRAAIAATAAIATLAIFAPTASAHPTGYSVLKRLTNTLKTFGAKFKKKKSVEYSASEVTIEVEPQKNYSVTLKPNQRLALILDANDGRIWHIESRPDEIADERPEGKASVTFTTIYFTPKEVDGEGDLVLKTKILENYPEDWTNADTCIVHLTVHNKKQETHK